MVLESDPNIRFLQMHLRSLIYAHFTPKDNRAYPNDIVAIWDWRIKRKQPLLRKLDILFLTSEKL